MGLFIPRNVLSWKVVSRTESGVYTKSREFSDRLWVGMTFEVPLKFDVVPSGLSCVTRRGLGANGSGTRVIPDLFDIRSGSGDLRVCFNRLRGDLVTTTLLPSLASTLGRPSVRMVSRGKYTWDGISVCRDHAFGMFRLSRLVLISDSSVSARDDFGESGVGGRGLEVSTEESEGRVSVSLSEKDFFLHHPQRSPCFLFSSRLVFQGADSRFVMRSFDFR